MLANLICRVLDRDSFWWCRSRFKPAPDRWSVAEVAEHITVTESMIFGMIQKQVMASPAAPEKRAEVKGKDEPILTAVPDRSHKAQAPEMRPPKAIAIKSEGRTYAVKSGDTLASISRKFYKTSARWKEILRANKDKIDNPENLKVGQTLTIP